MCLLWVCLFVCLCIYVFVTLKLLVCSVDIWGAKKSQDREFSKITRIVTFVLDQYYYIILHLYCYIHSTSVLFHPYYTRIVTSILHPYCFIHITPYCTRIVISYYTRIVTSILHPYCYICIVTPVLLHPYYTHTVTSKLHPYCYICIVTPVLLHPYCYIHTYSAGMAGAT